MSKIKQNKWHLDTTLPISHTIPDRYFRNAPGRVVDDFCQLLSRDVFSEGDSQFFYDYIMTRKKEFSPDFLSFLNLWLADELKHYEALRRVYHCVSGISFNCMDLLFKKRIHEIEPIKILLEDEFTILVAFTFDEIGSVFSYRRDLWQYYGHFGSKIQKIAHYLIKDEGQHFNNAAELLLTHHQHRLTEVPIFLDKISFLENSLTKYYKTFFLDHAQEKFRFPRHFNRVIVRFILARLGLGKRPHQKDLRELWQWTNCSEVKLK